MNPFLEIKRIAFELSNRCVYAERHEKCPAHEKLAEPTRNLPALTFKHVLERVKAKAPGYSGLIYFHLFNEPLGDPRLFEFVRHASRSLPAATIQITTNGWIYDQVIHDELAWAGVRVVRFSIYSKGEYERLSKLRPNGIKVLYSTTPKDRAKNPEFWGAPECDAWKHILRDDIPKVYEGQDRKKADGRCLAPYQQLCISSSAEVVLCCMDWRRTVAFGSLRESSLDEILNSPNMKQAAVDLRRGAAGYDVCRRCVHHE
jgi:hypothetical protein